MFGTYEGPTVDDHQSYLTDVELHTSISNPKLQFKQRASRLSAN
jgi:hypothetical protein